MFAKKTESHTLKNTRAPLGLDDGIYANYSKILTRSYEINISVEVNDFTSMIYIVATCSQPCRYYLLWAIKTLMALKHVYMVKRNLYIYNIRNFFSSLM